MTKKNSNHYSFSKKYYIKIAKQKFHNPYMSTQDFGLTLEELIVYINDLIKYKSPLSNGSR